MQGKNILVGITGSIAAYKAAMLVRLLIRNGASVRVIMTASARDFITPLTMATVSRNPILVENFDPENGAWNSHISLGEWADLFVVAPATANTMAKMAAGIADNLLLCTYLSARCPVMVAPAMDFDMYLHTTTQGNIQKLRDLGVMIVEPGDGFLASGLTGKGRMSEPEEIVHEIEQYFSPERDLEGIRVMVTAGATIEPIDPVRFLSNHSTGKMGYALADELYRRGAKVTLVSGAATAALKHPEIRIIRALSAEAMYEAAVDQFETSDCAIFCAAVADYTPVKVADRKIKHTQDELMLHLRPTKDIARELGARKRKDQITIGFALETNDEQANAQAKLKAKNLDAIVLNSLAHPGAGFATDTNRITTITADGSKQDYPLKNKSEVASDIVDLLKELISKCYAN